MTDPAARAAALDGALTRQEGVDAQLRLRLGADADEPQTVRARLYRAFLEMRFFCQSGNGGAAHAAFGRAQALAPEDPDFLHAARACGLKLPGVIRCPAR